MSPENNHRPIEPTGVTSIRINLAERAIELENEHGTVARLDFSGPTVLFDAGQVAAPALPEGRPPVAQSEHQPVVEHTAPATTTAPASPEKQPVVSLVGTIGTAPEFQTTQRGKFKGRFRLRIDDGEQVIWCTVLGFDKVARRWQGTLVKGQAVTVRGYEHEQRYTRKDGTERREVEVYAAAVTRQKQTNEPSRGEPDA